MKRILFLAPHPPYFSASQRFRLEHYLEHLTTQGFEYDYHGFLDLETWNFFFKPGHIPGKIFGIIKGFGKRISMLASLSKYDFVYIHREAAPVGPPLIEWWIKNIARKKIIYDFDDAIWFKVASASNPYAGLIKCSWKVKAICRYAWKVTVGNEFLAGFARAHNDSVIIIPTVVDTLKVHNRIKVHKPDSLTVGWTGTFTNFPHLKSLIATINKLQQSIDFRFLVIADKDPFFTECTYEFLKWNKQSEIDDLLLMDIGLMPLNDTPLTRGKCAFKAIQYMSLGIPAVVSDVGANKEVVDDGINGFVCETMDEWYNALKLLLTDGTVRSQMGLAAREKISRYYSVNSTKAIFCSIFQEGETGQFPRN